MNEDKEKDINLPKVTEKPEVQIKRGANDLFSGISSFFNELIDLKKGLDIEGTIINIKNNKRMRGANAWLLMCSIMIASLGLDLNSPAVIIGAMLISPLMSPVLGIGLAVGINDKITLSIALQHFGIAIAIAIITSTLYFYFTLFGEATPEIIARTSPTLLDVLVAFFGGLAGIISGSRKDVSNAIPGVAIATALMPPLCVTGFGIATGDLKIILNSFYFFFLNATFIALATYIMVRHLDFPAKSYGTQKETIGTRWLLIGFSALVIIPSAFILFGVLNDLRDRENIKQFIDDNFENAICQHKKNTQTDSFEVKVFLFEKLDSAAQSDYQKMLAEKYEVSRARLNFFQTELPTLNPSDIEASVTNKIAAMLEAKETIENERDRVIQGLRSKLDSLSSKELILNQISKEVKVVFPHLEECKLYIPPLDEQKKFDLPPLAQVKWSKQINKTEEERLRKYLIMRTGLDSIKVR